MQPTSFNDNALLHEASKRGEDMETPHRGKSSWHKMREGGIAKFESHGVSKGVPSFTFPGLRMHGVRRRHLVYMLRNRCTHVTKASKNKPFCR